MIKPDCAFTSRPLSEPIAYYRGAQVTVAELLATSRKIAETLPHGSEVINLCGNRFHFLVYFCATLMVRGKSILPPNKQPDTIASLARKAHNVRRIVRDSDLELPEDLQPVTTVVECINLEHDAGVNGFDVPLDETVVEVFTSGSTGEPKKICKTWGILQGTAKKLCARLKCGDTGLWDLVATVPCQHMFGLEASVLMPLLGKFVCHDETPFYPQDVIHQVALCKRPVRLITTPVHLRAIVTSQTRLPEALRQVISATAPLSGELAQRTEMHSRAEVFEIFGFSEAGSVATRRTVAGSIWELLPGFFLEHSNPPNLRSDHLPESELFPDNLEIINATQFRFLSREGDHINIGGKRMSLSDLQIKLLDLSGVQDAHLYISQEKQGRPTGFVVTQRSVKELLQALSRVVDPVFLPRPLIKIQRIERNATGKVTRAELAQMKGEPLE